MDHQLRLPVVCKNPADPNLPRFLGILVGFQVYGSACSGLSAALSHESTCASRLLIKSPRVQAAIEPPARERRTARPSDRTNRDPLTYRWELLRESNKQNKDGSWETQQFKVPNGVKATHGSVVTFRTPGGRGGYRLFVYVTDPYGNSASANFPFMVEAAD